VLSHVPARDFCERSSGPREGLEWTARGDLHDLNPPVSPEASQPVLGGNGVLERPVLPLREL
jgi:hypothetical protein